MNVLAALAALADPVTRARVDSVIEDFRARSVPPTPLNVIAAVTDAGVDSDAAALIAEALEQRVQERGGEQ